MEKLAQTIVVAAMAYGLYYFFTHYDVTLFPPSDQQVSATVKKGMPQFADYTINVINNCAKTQGGITDGIYTCGIEVNGSGTEAYEMKVQIRKFKGNWVLAE